MVDMAHFAGLVAAGLHPNPLECGADVVTTTTHKTLGGPRAGIILCKEQYAKKIDSAVFPGQQGGPLEHVIAAKAVALQIAASELFRERQERTVGGCAVRSPSELLEAGHGVNVLTGGTDVHLVLVDLREAEPVAERQTGRGPPARDRDHRQPQRGALRSAAADGGLGAAHRHARACDARAAAWRTSSRSASILAVALTPAYEQRRGRARRARRAIVERYPLYEGLLQGSPA